MQQKHSLDFSLFCRKCEILTKCVLTLTFSQIRLVKTNDCVTNLQT